LAELASNWESESWKPTPHRLKAVLKGVIAFIRIVWLKNFG
jgi:hypothetical protein